MELSAATPETRRALSHAEGRGTLNRHNPPEATALTGWTEFSGEGVVGTWYGRYVADTHDDGVQVACLAGAGDVEAALVGNAAGARNTVWMLYRFAAQTELAELAGTVPARVDDTLLVSGA